MTVQTCILILCFLGKDIFGQSFWSTLDGNVEKNQGWQESQMMATNTTTPAYDPNTSTPGSTISLESITKPSESRRRFRKRGRKLLPVQYNPVGKSSVEKPIVLEAPVRYENQPQIMELAPNSPFGIPVNLNSEMSKAQPVPTLTLSPLPTKSLPIDSAGIPISLGQAEILQTQSDQPHTVDSNVDYNLIMEPVAQYKSSPTKSPDKINMAQKDLPIETKNDFTVESNTHNTFNTETQGASHINMQTEPVMSVQLNEQGGEKNVNKENIATNEGGLNTQVTPDLTAESVQTSTVATNVYQIRGKQTEISSYNKENINGPNSGMPLSSQMSKVVYTDQISQSAAELIGGQTKDTNLQTDRPAADINLHSTFGQTTDKSNIVVPELIPTKTVSDIVAKTSGSVPTKLQHDTTTGTSDKAVTDMGTNLPQYAPIDGVIKDVTPMVDGIEQVTTVLTAEKSSVVSVTPQFAVSQTVDPVTTSSGANLVDVMAQDTIVGAVDQSVTAGDDITSQASISGAVDQIFTTVAKGISKSTMHGSGADVTFSEPVGQTSTAGTIVISQSTVAGAVDQKTYVATDVTPLSTGTDAVDQTHYVNTEVTSPDTIAFLDQKDTIGTGPYPQSAAAGRLDQAGIGKTADIAQSTTVGAVDKTSSIGVDVIVQSTTSGTVDQTPTKVISSDAIETSILTSTMEAGIIPQSTTGIPPADQTGTTRTVDISQDTVVGTTHQTGITRAEVKSQDTDVGTTYQTDITRAEDKPKDTVVGTTYQTGITRAEVKPHDTVGSLNQQSTVGPEVIPKDTSVGGIDQSGIVSTERIPQDTLVGSPVQTALEGTSVMSKDTGAQKGSPITYVGSDLPVGVNMPHDSVVGTVDGMVDTAGVHQVTDTRNDYQTINAKLNGLQQVLDTVHVDQTRQTEHDIWPQGTTSAAVETTYNAVVRDIKQMPDTGVVKTTQAVSADTGVFQTTQAVSDVYQQSSSTSFADRTITTGQTEMLKDVHQTSITESNVPIQSTEAINVVLPVISGSNMMQQTHYVNPNAVFSGKIGTHTPNEELSNTIDKHVKFNYQNQDAGGIAVVLHSLDQGSFQNTPSPVKEKISSGSGKMIESSQMTDQIPSQMSSSFLDTAMVDATTIRSTDTGIDTAIQKQVEKPIQDVMPIVGEKPIVEASPSTERTSDMYTFVGTTNIKSEIQDINRVPSIQSNKPDRETSAGGIAVSLGTPLTNHNLANQDHEPVASVPEVGYSIDPVGEKVLEQDIQAIKSSPSTTSSAHLIKEQFLMIDEPHHTVSAIEKTEISSIVAESTTTSQTAQPSALMSDSVKPVTEITSTPAEPKHSSTLPNNLLLKESSHSQATEPTTTQTKTVLPEETIRPIQVTEMPSEATTQSKSTTRLTESTLELVESTTRMVASTTRMIESTTLQTESTEVPLESSTGTIKTSTVSLESTSEPTHQKVSPTQRGYKATSQDVAPSKSRIDSTLQDVAPSQPRTKATPQDVAPGQPKYEPTLPKVAPTQIETITTMPTEPSITQPTTMQTRPRMLRTTPTVTVTRKIESRNQTTKTLGVPVEQPEPLTLGKGRELPSRQTFNLDAINDKMITGDFTNRLDKHIGPIKETSQKPIVTNIIEQRQEKATRYQIENIGIMDKKPHQTQHKKDPFKKQEKITDNMQKSFGGHDMPGMKEQHRNEIIRPDEPPLESLCVNSAYIDGIGYAEYPGHCQKLVQCYQYRGRDVAVLRECPAGYFWHQDLTLCRPPAEVPCFDDPCLDIDVVHYNRTEGCRSFFSCEYGISVPQCCDQGFRYNGVSCVPDKTCNDPCVTPYDMENSLRFVSCKFLPDEYNPYGYLTMEHHGLRIRACPTGTIFSARQCGCRWISGRRQSRRRMNGCRPSFYMNFNYGFKELSGSNMAFDVSNVVINDGAAQFDGKGKITLWGFMNKELGKQFAIRLKFKPDPSSTGQGSLVSNCGMTGTSTVSIGLDKHQLKLSAKSMSFGSSTVIKDHFDPYSWNDVTYLYDGNNFIVSTNGYKQRKPLGGLLETRSNAIVIGGCPRPGTGFKGLIDSIEIFSGCIPRDIYKPRTQQ